MENKKDFTKDEFLNFWGKDGYVHTWDAYDRSYEDDIVNLIKNELGYSKEKTTLEIGAGGGYWTKHLIGLSKQVIALDVIEKPSHIDNSVVWMQRNNMQFNCEGISDNSIDFVFSYGVFCHFSIESCEKYLTDIRRVMRDGSTAILMYADEAGFERKEDCASIFGHTNNYNMTTEMVDRVGLKYKKILEFRHTLLLLTK